MAGTEVGKGVVKLEADGADLAKSIEKQLGAPVTAAAEKAGKEAGTKLSKSINDASSKDLVDFGKKGLAVTAGLVAGLYASADAAGSLQAAIASNKQVLGDSSVAVQAWAKDSVENVGLSERAALDASTAFGQLGKIAGEQGQGLADFSTELVELAADMAAFKDVSPEQALQDLQSGFAGSTEVLRKYGIFLDDAGLKQAYFTATGEKASAVLTAQERVIATHQAIMEKSKDMQGQWARESNGFQAQQAKAKAELENLAASIGQVVLPAFSAIVGGVGKGAHVFGELNDATGGLIGKLGGVAAVGIGTVSSIAAIIGKAKDLSERFHDTEGNLTSMGKAAGALGATLGVVGLAITAYSVYAMNKAEATKRTDDLAAALKLEGSAQNEALTALAASDQNVRNLLKTQQLLGITTRDVAQYMNAGTGPVQAIAEAYETAGVNGGDWVNAQRILRKELNLSEDVTASQLAGIKDFVEQNFALKDSQQGVKLATDLVNDANGDYVSTIDRASKFVGEYGTALDRVTGSTELSGLAVKAAGDRWQALADQQAKGNKVAAENLGRQYEILGGQTTISAGAADVFTDALDRMADGASANLTSSINLADAYDGLQTAIKDNGREWDINTDKGRQNTQALLQVGEAIRTKVGQALRDSGGDWSAATNAATMYREELHQQLLQMGLTEQQAQDYLSQLGLTPEQIETTIKLSGDELAKQNIDLLNVKLEDIPASKQTEYLTLINDGEYQQALQLINDLTVDRTAKVRVSVGIPKVTPGVGGMFTGGPMQWFAKGTNSAPGGLAGLAEQGAELVTDPGVYDLPRGSKVWTADETSKMLGRMQAAPLAPGDGGGRSVNHYGDIIIQDRVDLDAYNRQQLALMAVL